MPPIITLLMGIEMSLKANPTVPRTAKPIPETIAVFFNIFMLGNEHLFKTFLQL